MKINITNAFPPKILENESEIKISLYMPTHRTSPDNNQDVVRFKNMLSTLDKQLKGSKHRDIIFKKLETLAKDIGFWIYNLDGLVILMSENEMEIYRLPRTVKEYVFVGDSFYLKPLIMNYQSDHQYFALGLARDHFKLFKGNRYGFMEVALPEDDDVTLKEVLGDQVDGRTLNFGGYGGRDTMYHGHNARSEEIKVDTERYFRFVDKYISDNYTSKYKIPLILVSLPEHQGLFRSLSQSRFLLEKGINQDYQSISEQDFKPLVWNVLEPIYLEKTEKLIKGYHEGASTDSLKEILVALSEKRVKSLVIELDKQLLGHIDFDKQRYVSDEIKGTDMLNTLASYCLRQNIEVVILPKDRMPTETGVFALFHY